jgi:hypothetical protein
MDTWVFPIFCHYGNAMYKLLCGHVFSFLLFIYLGVKLLSHMLILCLMSWGTAKLFSKVTASFLHSHKQYMRVLISPILTNTHYYIFWITAILADVKWYFTVIFIFISLMTNEIEHLFMCLVVICISSLAKCL